MLNSSFTIAIHILTLLEWQRRRDGGEPVSSSWIAGSVNTNPVVIRRLLGALRKAGLVESRSGSAGGWVLREDARAIELRTVYRLTNSGELFPGHNNEPNPLCEVGRNVRQALNGHFAAAREAMEEELARVTIAGVLENIEKQPGPD